VYMSTPRYMRNRHGYTCTSPPGRYRTCCCGRVSLLVSNERMRVPKMQNHLNETHHSPLLSSSFRRLSEFFSRLPCRMQLLFLLAIHFSSLFCFVSFSSGSSQQGGLHFIRPGFVCPRHAHSPRRPDQHPSIQSPDCAGWC
jgi:hypothetical protein